MSGHIARMSNFIVFVYEGSNTRLRVLMRVLRLEHATACSHMSDHIARMSNFIVFVYEGSNTRLRVLITQAY